MEFCCVECGSTKQVGLMGNATVCRECIKKAMKKLGQESVIFDKHFFFEQRQRIEMANKMMEAEKDKDKDSQ